MKEIDERSLKLNVYEYFQYCNKTRCIRGAAVITDKQYIFYSQILKDDYGTHNDIEIDIENAIHPNNQKYGWDAYYKNHAYVASVGKELIISMPENGELSLSQATFLSDILNQTNKYNQDKKSDKPKIKIDFFDTSEHDSYFDTTDIEFLKQKIQERITTKITIEEEKIIGTTLPKETIKNNLLEYLKIEECSNMKEVIDVLKKCSIYYQDSYYKNIFCEVFPDYAELKELIILLYNINVENEKVENVNFKNVKEIIYSAIRNIFKYTNSYSKLYNCLFDYGSGPKRIPEEIIQKIFPNFELISTLFIKICPNNDEETKYINNILKDISNYEDFSKAVCNLAYGKYNQELIQTQILLNNENKALEEIKIKKNIVASKDMLNAMIDKKRDLEQLINNYDLKLGQTQIQIDKETKFQNDKNKIIKDSSLNFFKKTINKRKIKEHTTELNSSKLKSKTLEKEKEEQLKKIENLKKEIKDIEKKFKDITHLDYFPFDKSFMEIYYEKDYSEYENQLSKWIADLNQRINLLKKEISRIVETGLITQNTKVKENIEKEFTISSRHTH